VADEPGVSRPVPRWRRWLLLAAVVLAAVLAFGVGYQRGQLGAGLDAARMAREHDDLQEKVTRLESENSGLNAKVAELEMARRLDRDAYGQVERTLGDLQSRLSRQGDDLAFYRSIVSPADGVQGLRIQRFEVMKGENPRDFDLKLTLIQAMRQESVVSGLAQVTVHGMQGERPAKYSLGELIGKPRAQLPFSFRYFQTIEQTVTLPEGFEAFEAEVQVRSSKLKFPVEQRFPWKVADRGLSAAPPDEPEEAPRETAR
jgi:outer membrane murein-binding lipoprotein Lpp